MTQTEYVRAAEFEHRFWLQILGDHARFITNTLAVKEQQEVVRANQFIQVFDELLTVSRRSLTQDEVEKLNANIDLHVKELKNFKLHLLRRHLEGKIQIGLSPTFLNHMLNELEEYQRILHNLLKGQLPPVFHPLHHHLLWLDDAIGHVTAVENNLDEVESMLLEKGKLYKKHFTDFYYKAVQFAGYLRTNLAQFPALSRFNQQVALEMVLFKEFLIELEEARLTDEVLGILSPLMADHMVREECYYLTKLSTVSHIQKPACDPTHPRKS